MRRNFTKNENDKILIYSVAGVAVLLLIVFALLMYGNSLNNDVRNSQLSSDQIASIVNNETDSESASSSIGKSVEEQEKNQETEEMKEETNNKNTTTSENTQVVSTETETNNTNLTNTQTATTSTTSSTSTNSTAVKQQETNNNNTKKENKKELSFQKPVEGEIVREFANENLIYSETLQEWVTHMGIDIKAEKTTVVQSAEAGTVKSIKNDPRYGLTVVIEHDDGFQTVYANLLSSEFVKTGEKVTKGQSIGTIGNTAVFESSDEPHLHFEVLKDSVQVDPNIYIK